MQRDRSIDALRGLAIALVVLGHAVPFAAAVFHDGPGLVRVDAQYWVPTATASSPLFSLIYAFHMPLFAFVSGLVLWPPRARPVAGELLRRVRSLLLPYLVWFFMLTAIAQLKAGALLAEGWGVVLLNAVTGRGGLWYLYSLFLSATVVALLARVPGRRWTIPATALAAIVAPMLVDLPAVLHLSATLWIHPFVVLGYMWAPAKEWVIERRWYVAGVATLTFLPLLYLCYPIHLPHPIEPLERLAAAMHDVGLPGGSLLASGLTRLLPFLCATAALLALHALFVGRGGRAIDVQAWLGRRSLGIYAIHGPLLWSLIDAGVRDPLILAAVGLAVSAGLTALLERVPLVSLALLGQPPVRRARPQAPPPEDTPAVAREDSAAA